MFIEFSEAVAFLLALCFIQSFISRRWSDEEPISLILSGILFGSICVIGMVLPIEVSPGVIFDPRSVVLSIAGLFGGPVVGGIATAIAGGYRLWIGGGGATVGISVVILSVLLGLSYRYGIQRGWLQINIWQLLAFGLVVNTFQIYIFTFLPEDVVEQVMESVALPLVLIFTPATALLGGLLYLIEDQVKTSKSLQKSEKKYQQLIETMKVLPWQADPTTFKFTYVGPQAETIFGYPIEDWFQDNFWIEHVHPLDHEHTVNQCIEHTQNDEDHDFEYRMVAADGKAVWVRDIVSTDLSNNLVQGVMIDITQRKEAELALLESEETLRTAIESIPDGFALFDSEGRLVVVNENYFKERPELKDIIKIGVTFKEQAEIRERLGLREDDTDRYAFSLQERLDRYNNPGEPFLSTQSDGRVLQINDVKTLQNGVAIIRTDVTELDQAKTALQNANKDLEARIKERTIHLEDEIIERKKTEKKLTVAKQEAEELSKVKSDFLASMSHEFRTPLNGIIGFSQLLETLPKEKLSPKQNEYVGHILDCGNHLLQLINDILDVSASEFGNLSLNVRDVLAGPLIEESLRFVEPQAKSKNILISSDIDKNLTSVNVDDLRFRQILINLLSNAVKFTPENGEISLNSTILEKNGFSVTVSDTGIGMTKSEIKESLKPFTQIDSLVSSAEKGTGLGLPLAKILIEAHGGTLEIKSKKNVGTAVTIIFPG